jgi:hypothetical protein
MKKRKAIALYVIPAFTTTEQMRDIYTRLGSKRCLGLFQDDIKKEDLPTSELPQLVAAIEACYRENGALWTPCLSPIWPNEVFTVGLRLCDIPILILDSPEMTKYDLWEGHGFGDFSEWRSRVFQQLQQSFSRAEKENKGKKISKGMAEARRRGVRLGNPHIAEAQAKAARAREARQPSAEVLRSITSLREEGHGFHAIARILNERGIKSVNGKLWHGSSVRNLLRAIDDN